MDRSLTDVTISDLRDRSQIEVTGADRATFLHGFCTNDIKSLRPGTGCEAFFTNIKGRVVGHAFVFATEHALWLDMVPGQAERLIAHLDRYLIREDVQLLDRTPERADLFVSGPAAADLLMIELDLPRCGHLQRELAGHELHFRRVDLFGVPGFLVSVPRDHLETMIVRLSQVGCRNLGPDEFESRRIEAGYPVYGRDITDGELAQEVARNRECISFTKGCYLGQEPIARLDALGHTNRELRRIVFEAGAQMVPGPLRQGDQEVGILTSVAPLPGAGGTRTALGYLKTAFAKPGTGVLIDQWAGTVELASTP